MPGTGAHGVTVALRRVGLFLGKTLLGIALTLLLLELGLRLIGFGFRHSQDTGNRLADPGETTILSLGESPTALYGEDAYPRQLEGVLTERTAPGKFRVVNKGMPGADSTVIVAQLDHLLAQVDPDVVTVMMGINDDKDLFSHLRDYPGKPAREVLLQRLKVYRLYEFLSMELGNKREREARDEAFEELRAEMLASVRDADPAQWLWKYGTLHRRHGRYPEAERVFLEFARRYPTADAYFEVGRIYRDTFDERREEEWFLRLLARFPDEDVSYRGIVRCYRRQGRTVEAERILRQHAERMPSVTSYCNLGNFYLGEQRVAEAQAVFLAAAEYWVTGYAYARLGECYRRQGDPEQAERMIRLAIGEEPCGEAYTELGKLLVEMDRQEEAEEAFVTAMDLGPMAWRYYDYFGNRSSQGVRAAIVELAGLYERQGRNDQARETLSKTLDNPMTTGNYQTLADKVHASGARLVVVQYPMRDIAPLRAMFPGRDDIAFVDNEESFRRAVAHHGYNAYFSDAFAGDFGHGTQTGNRLIAENIADVILTEFFAE